MLEFLQILFGAFACLIPLAVGQRLGLLPYCSPMHFVGYFAFFGFTVKAVAYFIWPEFAFYSRWIISDSQVGWGYAYTGGFIFFMCVGYVMAARPTDRADIGKARELFQHVKSPVFLMVVAVIALSVATLTYIFARGGAQAEDTELVGLVQDLNARKIQRTEGGGNIGESFAFIKVFFVIPSVIFAILLAQALVKRKSEYWTYTALTGILILVAAIIQGKRADLIDIAVISLVTISSLGLKINIRNLLIGILFVPVVLVVFSFMSVLRSTRGDLAEAQLLSAEPLEQIVGSTYFLDINAPIMISAMIRPEQMLWGSSYVTWLFAWIPRTLWADKPVVAVGPYFKNVIMQMNTQGVGGFNPTGAGEAYINFGPWGLLVGLAVGFAFRRGEVNLLSAKATERIYGPVIYATVFVALIQGVLQSSFSGVIVSCAAQAVIVYLTCRLVLQARKSRRPLHRPRLRPRY